jgi:hypothetical protein
MRAFLSVYLHLRLQNFCQALRGVNTWEQLGQVRGGRVVLWALMMRWNACMCGERPGARNALKMRFTRIYTHS